MTNGRGRLRASMLVTVLVVAACAGGPTTRTLDNGDVWVDCSDGTPGWGSCHRLARKACRGDFDIQSQTSNEGSSGVGRNDWSRAGSIITRSIVVTCRATPGAATGQAG